MSERLRTIIVDDEPIAIGGLCKYIQDIKFMELVGMCENALDANELINTTRVDLMFLDIQMPKITGMQLLKTLKVKPITIVTSAYSEYAVEGFENEVLDYLLKPISQERFIKAANKAKDYYDLLHSGKTESDNGFLFVKSERKIEKIFYQDILYIESLHNYVSIVTPKGRIVAYLTLKAIEDALPKEHFLKVQKSFIVAISKVRAIQENEIVIESKRIPISRQYKDEIIRTILGNNYLKR